MYTKYPAYDIIEGPNGSVILDIAIPGLNKSDLEAELVQNTLRIKTVTKAANNKVFIARGIRDEFDASWRLGEDQKIDSISCSEGILRVLISKKLELPRTNKIEIY